MPKDNYISSTVLGTGGQLDFYIIEFIGKDRIDEWSKVELQMLFIKEKDDVLKMRGKARSDLEGFLGEVAQAETGRPFCRPANEDCWEKGPFHCSVISA